jgi:LPXTG-site transpeptidase (sortase) family protein
LTIDKNKPPEHHVEMNAMQKRISLLTLVLLLFSLSPIQSVQAATLTVSNANGTGVGSLRQAIADANSGDTITFDASLSGATITLASPLTLYKNVTIDGSALSSPLSISGNSSVSVFNINSGIAVILDSLTIKYGNANSGGGINNKGTLTVNNSTFSGNSAKYFGGGIFNENGGNITVNNSTFSGNSSINGGGIYNQNGSNTTVNNSTFSGNSARMHGGGINNRGNLDIDNSTFSGNSADHYGGGIFNYNSLTVNNSTFSGNFAYGGGGIYNTSAGSLRFRNTILANSQSGSDCFNDGGTIDPGNTNNLVETQSGCGIPAFSSDPFLASLANNGGDTQTMTLLPGSVAINAGDNATCTSTDQRGVTRTLGGTCDIGAYESGASILTIPSSTPAENAAHSNLTNITVNFSEDALHDGSNKAANYADNYLLVEPGLNDTFDTLSCTEGLQSDDTAIPFTVSYNSSTFTSTLTFANPLPLGNYRLFVCGTTSIWSAAGLELNNGDSDSLLNFSVVTPAPAPVSSASVLPDTGFPMGMKTDLPAQPAPKTYSNTALTLDIPAMHVKTDIVGVPFVEDTWDVSWLDANTGWLEGSATPTWAGNTVLTGHVWDANNQPGVFADLKSLKYGDQFYIHAWGQTYTYEVRENKLVTSGNTKTVLQNEDLDWITLLTCESYNPNAQTYPFRRMVRAVLVKVE